MKRRDFLQGLAAGSIILLLPESVRSAGILSPGNDVAFRCLGNVKGPRYLDGRTKDATVGLAPSLVPKYSGTKWRVTIGGPPGVIALRCEGSVPGIRWLDGRTKDGSVGLAPKTTQPYSGTRWEVRQLDPNNPNIIGLKCRGDIEGPRWLDGRTGNGTVGLAKSTEPPFTGTHWEVSMYPADL